MLESKHTPILAGRGAVHSYYIREREMVKRPLTVLSIISPVSAIISACFGLLYSFGGAERIVENIYGQQVTLFGDGVYANDSVMKGA